MRRLLGEDASVLFRARVPPDELDALERAMVEGLDLPTPLAGMIDMHCHLGRDADGHRLAADTLLADLDRHGVSAAVCFPANDPGSDGQFGAANAAVLEDARRSDGRIIPFCRVDPGRDVEDAMQRAAAGGARGLKLHPVAQRFSLDDPGAARAVQNASDRGWPTLIHTGFAARRLAAPLAHLLNDVPDARLILAHGARGDARAIIDVVAGAERVWFDTSLATLPDLVAIGPQRLCFGSDRPYGDMATALLLVARAAEIGRWSSADLRGVLGDHAARLLA